MKRYRDLSIKTKLSLIALVTCVTALGLASAALFVFEVHSFKRTLVSDLQAQAALVAGVIPAALEFDETSAAEEMLGELANQRQIKWAVVFRNGVRFAQYQNRAEKSTLPTQPPSEIGAIFTSQGLLLSRDIRWKGDRIGLIYLCADTSELQSRLWEYAAILLAVFVASSLVGLVMASRLQRAIVIPVQRLADTSRVIAERQDYSTRVEPSGRDELGRLTEAFNQMLNRIQMQDAELREGRERFEVAVAGARDGIWDWSLMTNEMYLSPQWMAMLGHEKSGLANNSEFWLGLYHPEDQDKIARALTEYLDGKRATYEVEGRMRHKDGGYRWILTRGAALRDPLGKPYRMAGSITDITERKEASEQITRMQRELVDASRVAGMAEVATGVLHNVGNVLNSVNISATLLLDQLRKSKTASLAKAVELLREHQDDLAEFLTNDPKGKQLPAFFDALAGQLTREQDGLFSETQSLQQNIDHIKQIVAMQQSFAKVSGAMELLTIPELLEDALRMSSSGIARHRIEVVRQIDPVPPVLTDRHKVLQILVNLISNAKHAVENRTEGRHISLRVIQGHGNRVRVEVTDNGVGIPKENLNQVFNHGFTTKKTGHGFGLHSGANAAREMGGSLTAHSDGPGTGATFVLELPVAKNGAKPAPPGADGLDGPQNHAI